MKTYLLLALMACLTPLLAQTHHRCGQEEKMESMSSLQPGLLEEIERLLQPGMAEQRMANRHLLSGNTLYIPVHVIIVHQPNHGVGQGTNLSKNRILSQINAINLDFSRKNVDTINTPLVFTTGNPMIQFCMAGLDPDGNPTDGITRYPSTANFDEEEFDIKAETRWPRTEYLNIWVAEIEDLGYAYIPSLNGLPNSTLDGVVINTIAFGGPGFGAEEPYNLGRTATHEIGHFLGLQHVWRGSGCTNDDGFSDTPLQDDENYGCPVHPSPSCDNAGDMFMNYMDYTDDNCMNAFSAMQANHMRNILMGIRNSLMASGEVQCNTAALSAEIDSIFVPSCYNDPSGYVKVSAAGGIPPYSFKFRSETNNTGEFFQISPGEYYVVVKDAIEDSVMVFVLVLPPPPIMIDSFNVHQPLCFGDGGSVDFYASAGSPFNNQVYNLSINGVSYFPSMTADSLPAGLYTAVLTDSLGCTISQNFEITAAFPIEINLTKVSGIRCFGDSSGAIFITLAGGVAPVQVTVNGSPVTTAVVSGLKAGFYQFDVIDALGCTTFDSMTLVQPALLEAGFSQTEIACFGDKTATIEFTTGGGKPPYFYSIDGQHFSLSPLFTDLGANTYPLFVLDSDQCRWQDTTTIAGPPELLLEDILVEYETSTQSYHTTLKVRGGEPPYEIFVNTFDNPLEDSIYTTTVAGDYTFIIVDADGCILEKKVVFSGTQSPGLEEFSIGPNPVKDNLVIRYSGNKNEEADFKIYDISGKLIWEERQILFSPEKNIHNIFVNNVPNSIFIFKIALKFKSSHILIFKE
ncbi:MAG: hypothetical protein KA340_02860 [Saprospiraceae bacterium]|nr:hypothetical protein [Saprospiraceae bacterium]